MLVCGSNVPPKTNATGVLKFFDVFTAEMSPELGERAPNPVPCSVICSPREIVEVGKVFVDCLATDRRIGAYFVGVRLGFTSMLEAIETTTISPMNRASCKTPGQNIVS